MWTFHRRCPLSLSDRIKLLFAERGVPQPPEELIDDIEAAFVKELSLVDTANGTDYASQLGIRPDGEYGRLAHERMMGTAVSPLTDEERAFFAVCMMPDPRS
jgi:hypothetical protein